MTTTSELKPLLKRFRLGYLLNTLPERLALARRDQIDYAAFLQIILADEVTRRDNRNLEMHLQKAGFEEICRLEDFDWTAQITMNRRLVDAVFSLDFLNRHEHMLFVGSVGMGKSFLAQALGYPQCAPATASASYEPMLSSEHWHNQGSITHWRRPFVPSSPRT
jgi:DNA replication protein DnaC